MLQSNSISAANVSNDSSSTERIGSFVSKVSNNTASHSTKQVLNKTFNQTKTFKTEQKKHLKATLKTKHLNMLNKQQHLKQNNNKNS